MCGARQTCKLEMRQMNLWRTAQSGQLAPLYLKTGDHFIFNWQVPMFPSIRAQFDARVQKQATPLVIHIGPMNLGKPGEIEELQELLPWSPRIVFLEANPIMSAALEKKLNDSIYRAARIQVMNAAGCESATSNISFYLVSPRIVQDFPSVRYDDFCELASLDREHLLRELKHFFPRVVNSPGLSPQQWAAIETSYIDQAFVPCFTPASLLAELQVRPSDVDMFITDAEGYDFAIQNQALALEGFDPVMIKFEWCYGATWEDVASLHNSVTPLVNKLTARGYDVYMFHHDLVAVKSQA